MIRFLAKRLALALGILAVISVVIYFMLDLAMDPLADLRGSTDPNKEIMMQARIDSLHLDEPWYKRYWRWLTAFLTGDPGEGWRTKEKVATHLGPAISTSVQLVFTATILAILTGVTIGVISALRQYTAFDYAITFLSFILFSLPVFWVAVLLKEFLAIGMNDYLQNPSVSWIPIIGFCILAGLFWMGILGGKTKRRLIIFLVGFAVNFGILAYVFGTEWLLRPVFGIIGIAIVAVGSAFTFTSLFAGIQNKRALYAALTTAVVGIVLYYPMQWVFYYAKVYNFMADWFMLVLLLVALATAYLIGWLYGGPDRKVSMNMAALTALVTSIFMFIDKMIQGWSNYTEMVQGRPIATMGASTPSLQGDYWVMQLDKFTHLMLPTVALVVISFASYTRYERGAMLEVLNQDYVRTARAKGLPERVVIVRHALRNALLPLASLVPVDLIGMIGGAIMTESIFGWSGMGKYFRDSMTNSEADPVMAYIILVGALAMLANLIADFLYALLDPRIRVDA